MTDQEIVKGLEQNDPRVYEYLYRTWGGKVIGYVLKNGGTMDDAQDVLQEVLLQLPNAILTYQERGKLIQWFFTIVGNTWMQILRRRKKHAATSLDDLFYLEDTGDESLERKIVKDRKYEALLSALETLGEPCQESLRLFHLDKVPSSELAKKYNINDNAMRARLWNCRAQWRTAALEILRKWGL
jgi:RNA polymerase sigma factor (sigma-70 family)